MSSPTLTQQDMADHAKARAAKEKAHRIFPTELTRVVCDAINARHQFPGFVSRSRWLVFVNEIMQLEEP